jgi:hypothetical protein
MCDEEHITCVITHAIYSWGMTFGEIFGYFSKDLDIQHRLKGSRTNILISYKYMYNSMLLHHWGWYIINHLLAIQSLCSIHF